MSWHIVCGWKIAALTAATVCASAADSLNAASTWAALGEKFITLKERDGMLEVTHTGWSDWTLVYGESMKVAPGDVCTFSAEIGPGALPTRNRLDLSATLYGAAGRVIDWNYARTRFRVFSTTNETVSFSFAVPEGVSSVSPRATGTGTICFKTRVVRLSKSGTFERSDACGDVGFETGSLSVKVRAKDAGIVVIDKRTGRAWRSLESKGGLSAVSCSLSNGRIEAAFVDPLSLATNQMSVFSVRPDEITVEIGGEGVMPRSLLCPAAFETADGDRLVVPMQEGIGFPVEEKVPLPRTIPLSMPFFGVVDDKSGAGWMCHIETPDDASVVPLRANGRLTAGVVWLPQKGRFGYVRRLRFSFLPSGGHVAMAKRYREFARSAGRLVTFAEKRKSRPKIDALLGAANVWYFYGSNAVDSVELVRDMQASGIKKVLWSNGGNVNVLSKMTNVLVSTYDVYQDVGNPEQERKLGYRTANFEAWPDDVVWDGPTSNDWAYAWGIKAKDGTWAHCAMMCDEVAPRYARKKIAADMAKHGAFNCRFIDTTTAAPLRECWNPAHPMTRTDSRRFRRELLKVVCGEFKLVTGSENGCDSVLPWCDYFEGMMSLVHYRVPDSGRNQLQVWTNAPSNVVKFQIGEKYRLPLWELVYHDCCVAYWYWGDYNNKIPSTWRKRDLFNALYGTPPMFLFDGKAWGELRDRFVESYKCGGALAAATGYSEMLDHRILSADRSVQQTVFANGISVVVNFGEQPFSMADGTVVQSVSHVVVKHCN